MNNDLFDYNQPIKALSLWQPWASLMPTGVKLHETRHWSTSHRGLIAIHAAKTVDVAGAPEALCRAALGEDWRDTVPRGAIVAVAALVACHRTERVLHSITPADRAAGNFAPGRFAWEIRSPRALITPIRAVGRQGLWNWIPPGDLEALLSPPVDHEQACEAIGFGDRRDAA